MYRLFWRFAVRPSAPKVALLICLMVARAVIDVFRVALIVPLVSVLLESTDAQAEAILRTVYEISTRLGLGTDRTVILTAIGLLLFATVILEKGTALLLTIVTTRTRGSIRVALMSRMFDSYLGASYYETMKRGMAGVWQDLGASQAVSSLVKDGANAASSLVLLLAMGSLMMFLSWQATVFSIAVLVPVAFLLRRVFDRPSRVLSTQSYEFGVRRNRRLFDAIGGIRIAKMQGLRGRLVGDVRSAESSLVGLEVRKGVITSLPAAVNEIVGVSVILVLLALVLYVPQFGLSIPVVVALVLAIRRIAPSASNLGEMFLRLSTNYKQISVVGHVLEDMEQEADDGEELPSTISINEMELRSVSFSYPERPSERVVDDISLVVPRGRVTAIVGPTGAGKTTIADLFVGLYIPSSGEVLVDGTNLSDLKLSTWRSKVGYVGQDTFLFNGSISENIGLWRKDIEYEHVEAAAKAAAVHDFIVTLPDGYDTLVGDRGLKLSGGQRQRVAIARAILQKPQVFIFDEATSALDNVTEQQIQSTIFDLRADAVILIIAHRLSTLRNADEIFVLESGRVVEKGRHDALMALNGVYATLYRSRDEQPEPATLVQP